jgi:hypothetical protein
MEEPKLLPGPCVAGLTWGALESLPQETVWFESHEPSRGSDVTTPIR